MQIIGHEKERALLRQFATSGNISQSYLFSGPESVGKALVAFEFACLLAGEPDFEPTEALPHPLDVMILSPRQEKKRGVTKEKSISAEEAREGIQFLSKRPQSGYRVLIIRDAHRLSHTAQNALLKFVEEPEPQAVIILVTHDAGSLLSTLLSRVATTRFQFVPEALLAEKFTPLFRSQGESLPDFFFSLGRPGILFRALEDSQGFARDKELLSLLFRLSALSLRERLKLAEELAKDVPRAIRLLEWYLPGIHRQAAREEQPKRISQFFLFLENVNQTLSLLKHSQGNARLALESLFLAL
ncbi:MAG: hypothetical protein A2808_01395 [Candidatus Moranbacteria bacterium RIFCSPHIGHO2_01_FULL_55_24]|nr:MAG: hypothetical protein A2808_01395 [Candidatus Moranbacteria bacterium RIFCSPHIGHO2_01_FULL_55_24]